MTLTSVETLQTTKQNAMIAINNNYKVSKNVHTTNEDKNKQIHSQIKIHNKHLRNITIIDKYKKLNRTSTSEHKTEHNCTLVIQAINVCTSNKGVTKGIEHISNNKTKSILQFPNS